MTPAAITSLPTSAVQPTYRARRPLISPGVRRVQATPDDVPAPPPVPDANVPPAPPTSEPINYGGDSAPAVSEPGGAAVPSDNDLGTPRAEREGGGGEPTTAEAAAS